MKWYYVSFVLVVAAFSLAAAWNIPLETTVEVLPMVITVTNEQLGIHMTEEPQKAFDFGSTFPGTTVIKTMNITRGNQPPAMVSMSVQGSIAPWVELSAYDFLLDEPEQIAVAVKVPAEAPEGAYSGNLTIKYKKMLISQASSRRRG
jgi:hypothetical protein